MTLRLQTLFTGLIALLTAALLACAPVSAKGASGGYQLFEATTSGDQHAIQLASLENFNHHAKIAPECCNATKGTLDPSEVSFSQATVSGRTRDGLTIDELADSMRQNGWQGEPLNVISRDGVPTSMDNRRLLAARRAGIDVPVTVRNANDPLSPDQVRDFTVTGQPAPSTWGEALDLRIGRQGEMRGAPPDWAERFPNGSIYDPAVVE